VTFPKKNLNPGETIVLDMHPHWWYFAEPAFALLGSITLGILVLTIDSEGSTKTALSYLSIVALVCSAVWLVLRYVKWVTTNFVLTSNRVIFRSGIIAKRGVEIPINRVNNVNFNQTIFERLVGAGDLLIESGGEEGQSRYTDIRQPDEVQRMIHVQLQASQDRMTHGYAVGQPLPPPVDVADQLERLEAMLQRGTLSREEFEAQKRKLLDL
jgi:uncharacterized membrane protein YdbT with pleckstrin-like domain